MSWNCFRTVRGRDIRLFPFDQRDAALRWLRTDGRTVVRYWLCLRHMTSSARPAARRGFWLEELAAPYYVFKDAGASITLASPRATAATRSGQRRRGSGKRCDLAFKADAGANAQLAHTLPLSGVTARDFDAVF